MDRDGRTLLHLACIDGDCERVQELIDQGASLASKDRWGNDPLKYAMQAGHCRIAQKLLDAGAQPWQESSKDMENRLFPCAAAGDATTLKNLISCKVSVNAVDYSGQSALHLAAYHGRAEVVQILVEAGADTSQQNIWGKSTMDYAAQGGHVPIQQLLIKYAENCQQPTPEDLANSDSYKRKHHRISQKPLPRSMSMSNLMASPSAASGMRWASMRNLADRSDDGPRRGELDISSWRNGWWQDERTSSSASTLSNASPCSRTVRYLTAKGSALDADIRWGGDTDTWAAIHAPQSDEPERAARLATKRPMASMADEGACAGGLPDLRRVRISLDGGGPGPGSSSVAEAACGSWHGRFAAQQAIESWEPAREAPAEPSAPAGPGRPLAAAARAVDVDLEIAGREGEDGHSSESIAGYFERGADVLHARRMSCLVRG